MIEPRNDMDGKEDVVVSTEINTELAIQASRLSLPRGLRAWHVGHGEYVATRETLESLARTRVCRPTDTKGSKANGIQGVG